MNQFGFLLNVGDVVKLNSPIFGIFQSSTWKTGLYKVVSIHAGYGTHASDRDKAWVQSYGFKKIRKDGTEFKTFSNGYRAQAFDKFIQDGKATKI